MAATEPTSVREIGSLRPRLRPGVRFMFHTFGGERCCVLEDQLRAKYHRVGLAEYRLIRHFDGKTLFAEAVARAAMDASGDALSEPAAVSVLVWLVDNGLAELGGEIPVDVLRKAGGQRVLTRLSQMMNVLSIRVPLGNPDGFFRKVVNPLGFLAGPWFFVVWLVVFVAGWVQVLLNMDRLRSGTEGILAPDNWLLLMIVWVVIKVWHEFMHGLVVVKLGGAAREVGILFILFIPLGYVDATSSLAFHSKWKRMFVAAAGMYGELFLAGLAALVWAWTDPGVVNTIALNAMFTASVVTLLFNLNPLMRFDGYHILVDGLEMPNLGTRSMRMLADLARRWLLGLSEVELPDFHLRATWVYLIYGVAALLWRVMIITTLLVATALFMHGAGLIFAIIAGAWVLVPICMRIYHQIAKAVRLRSVQWRSVLLRCGLLVTLLCIIFLFPYRVRYVTSGVFRHADEQIYRAEVSGFVRAVHVQEKQAVEAGELLLVLENPVLETRLAVQRAALGKQELVWRLAQLDDTPAIAMAEAMARASLKTKVQELQRSVDDLTITAQQSGRVMTSELSSYPGRYVRRGAEVLRVANPVIGEVVIPVKAYEVAYFQQHVGLRVWARAEGRFRRQRGVMHAVGSRAVRTPDYPELTSLAGGRLAVRPVRDADADGPAYELVEPVVWGTVRLDELRGATWQPGERVRVKFRSRQTVRLSQRIVYRITSVLGHVLRRARARVED